MKRTLIISGSVLGFLLLVLALVRDPAHWPAPEQTPLQGEAADLASLGAQPIHAPGALARLVREPQNTWSNLAFVFGGAFLVSTAVAGIARATGGALIAVGIGSFLYHASATRMLRHLDVGAMYWLFLLAIALCVAALAPRWRARVENHCAAAAVVSLLVAAGMTVARNVTIFDVKPLSLTVATAVTAAVMVLSLAEIARRVETLSIALQFLGLVTLFGIATACQTLDRPGGPLYNPAAFVQAHAVWHVLAAGAFVWAVRLLDRAAMDVSKAQPEPQG